MEEIINQFEVTLSTEPEEDSTYKTLYKHRGKFGNQEQRRIEILKQQKSNRRNKQDSHRGIYNLIQSAQYKDGIFERSCQFKYKPNVYVPGFNKTSNNFVNVLMHSEWLIEKPEDFNTNWYVAPCPKGVRTLVVSCNGSTKCYTKFGQFKFAVPSLLPGGNHQERRNNCCVLDCFYNEDIKTMHVLDVLSWNNHIMADGQMEFRHFWLRTKFNEEPDFGIQSKRNEIIFKLIPMTPCDPESLQSFMMTYPLLPMAKLDGLLFYHKMAHYAPGDTPLVGWLFPYMVPEVLGNDITIHKSYASAKPKDYVDQATFIEKFTKKANKKKPFPRKNKPVLQETKVEEPISSPEPAMEAEDYPDLPHVDSIIEEEAKVGPFEESMNNDDDAEPAMLTEQTNQVNIQNPLNRFINAFFDYPVNDEEQDPFKFLKLQYFNGSTHNF